MQRQRRRNLRQRLKRQAAYHGSVCEHYCRLAMQPAITPADYVERIRRDTYRQLARIHAMTAFDLSAQAARS